MSAAVTAAEVGAHGSFSMPAIFLGVVLLLANAFFVASEIALLAARRARIEERAESGDRRAVVALALLRELPVTFSGAQLGITMASLGLGAVAEPAVAALFDRALGATPLAAAPRGVVAFVLGLGLVVFLHMVVGEMAPKNWSLSAAEEVSLRLARPFRLYVTLFRPLIVALNGTANLLVRMVGVEPRDEIGLVHTPDELLLVLREARRHGTLEGADARVLAAALRLGRIDAASAMTSRVDLHALADDEPATEILRLAAETGATRFPVYHGDLDDVVGLVNVKDALIRDDAGLDALAVADLLRPIAAVPEQRDLEGLLRDMRRDRAHAVLVVDEYGGTAGLLTLEDVLEELVGEIEDEFDPGASEARRTGERRWVVPGSYRRHEVEHHTGLALPAGDAETLSGHLTEVLGRFVEPGDEVTHAGWRIRVLTVGGRRAGDVEILAPPPDHEAAGRG